MSGFTFRLLRQAGGSTQRRRSACAIVTTTSASLMCYYHQQWNSQPKTVLAENAPSNIPKGSTSISKPVLVMKRLFETDLASETTTTTKISKGSVMQRHDEISLHDSVLIIPNAIPGEYCQMLCDEADRLIQNGYHRDRMGEDDEDTEQEDEELSLRRISTSDMSNRMQDLAMNMIQEDILGILQKELPSLLQSLGLSDWKRKDVEWEWASDEPTVNRYTAPGGTFEAHRDGYPLTIVIPLNDPSSFSGGGTRFFESSSSQEQSSNDHDGDEPTMMRRKSVTISPPAGTAICFDGDMLHAGAPVLKGVRYVFVASFGILST